MKKNISAIVIAVAVLGLSAGTAFAAPKTVAEKAEVRSACGAAHAADANENGNFGWLGEVGGTPGHHDGATGQEPGATGSNNSNTGCQE